MAALRAPGTDAISFGTRISVGIVSVDCRLRNIVDGREPSFRELLLPALLVEVDHLGVVRILEVGYRRIVEGQMPVLADAEQAELRIGGAKLRRILPRSQLRIGAVSVDLEEFAHLDFARQPLAQIAAEEAG